MFQTVSIRTVHTVHVHCIELPFTWNALIEAVADKEGTQPDEIRLIYNGESYRHEPRAEDGQRYVFQEPEPEVEVIL